MKIPHETLVEWRKKANEIAEEYIDDGLDYAVAALSDDIINLMVEAWKAAGEAS